MEDLFLDLRDGEILLSLLEILTAQQYVSIIHLIITSLAMSSPFFDESVFVQTASRLHSFTEHNTYCNSAGWWNVWQKPQILFLYSIVLYPDGISFEDKLLLKTKQTLAPRPPCRF